MSLFAILPTASLATLRTRKANEDKPKAVAKTTASTKSSGTKSPVKKSATAKSKPATNGKAKSSKIVASSKPSKKASNEKLASRTDCQQKVGKGGKRSGHAKNSKQCRRNRSAHANANVERSDAKIEAVRAYLLPEVPDYDLTDPKRYQLLDYAVTLLGHPYQFGAAGRAFDCSGFVRTVFGNVGVELPHSAREQFSLGDVIDREELAPGDLVFFHTYRSDASHVGIYMGEDKFIHSASGFGVKISSLSDDYYASHYLGARRVDI